MVKQVGEAVGLEVAVRGKLEPLRGTLSKLAGRGQLPSCRRPLHHAPVTCSVVMSEP